MLEIFTANPEKTKAICDFGGLVIGVFTVFLLFVNAIFMAIQAWIFRTTLKEGQKRTESDLRAYLVVTSNAFFFQLPGDKTTFESHPRVINSGRTPAHSISFQINGAILPTVLPPDFDFPNLHAARSSGILGNGNFFDFIVSVENIPHRTALTLDKYNRCLDSEIEAIKSNLKMAFWVWGIITYRDIFGKKRFTKFSQRYHWSTSINANGIIGERSMGFYGDRNNEADYT